MTGSQLIEVLEQVERYFVLDEILPVRAIERFKLPEGLPDQIDSLDEIEHTAIIVRDAWKLGCNPIFDLTGTLEERGIKVFQSGAYAQKQNWHCFWCI